MAFTDMIKKKLPGVPMVGYPNPTQSYMGNNNPAYPIDPKNANLGSNYFLNRPTGTPQAEEETAGTGNNSFLGTFLNLAKWAVPYTSNIIKQRREDKMKQYMKFRDMIRGESTPENIRSRGVGGSSPMAGFRFGGTQQGSKWGQSSGITTHTPSAYAGEWNQPGASPEAWRGYGEDVTGKAGTSGYGGYTGGNADVVNQAGGISSDMQKVMKKSKKTGAAKLTPSGQVASLTGQEETADVTPGQGNPFININPDGTWLEPTEEQLMAMLQGGG